MKFWKFQMRNGMAYSGCTDQTQATTCLIVLLLGWIQETTILLNGKRHFSVTGRTSQCGQPLFQIICSDQVKMVCSIWFPFNILDWMDWMESVQHYFYRMHVEKWTALPRRLIWVLSSTYCWTLQASHMSKALRRFLFDFSAILLDNSAGRVRPSFLQTLCKIWQIWRREIYEVKKCSKECHSKFPTNSSQL